MSDFSKEVGPNGGQLWRYLNDVNLQLLSLLNQDDRAELDVENAKYGPPEDARCQLINYKQLVPENGDQTGAGQMSVVTTSELCNMLDSMGSSKTYFQQLKSNPTPQMSDQLTQQVEESPGSVPSSNHLYSQYFQQQDNNNQQQYQSEALYYQQQQLQQQQTLLVNQTPADIQLADQIPLDCAYCAWLARVSQQSHQIQGTYSDC